MNNRFLLSKLLTTVLPLIIFSGCAQIVAPDPPELGDFGLGQGNLNIDSVTVSCNQSAAGVCDLYVGNLNLDGYQTSCEALPGTYAESDACPTGARVGSCVSIIGGSVTYTTYYYTNYDATDSNAAAKLNCEDANHLGGPGTYVSGP